MKINISEEKYNTIKKELKTIYDLIPDTTGCLDCIQKEPKDGGCGVYCCSVQNPQVLYCEFINAWKNWVATNDMDGLLLLIEKSLRNYLSNSFNKPCIFFDKNNKKCMNYDTRSFNCRTYSIIPDEEFKPRYEKLKVLAKKEVGAFVRDQCKVPKMEDGKTFTKKDIDSIWSKLTSLEEEIGVNKNNINDDFGGSYRTYHDHVIIKVFPEDIIVKLSLVRQYGKREEVEETVHNLIKTIRERINGRKD